MGTELRQDGFVSISYERAAGNKPALRGGGMSNKNQRIDRELAALRAALHDLLCKLGALLEDIAEADVDEPYHQPAIPIEDVPQMLNELACKLRNLFDLEEDERHLAALSHSRPELRVRFEALNAEHPQLLDQLDHLHELAGTTICPASTWDDIDHQYRGLEHRLVNHRRNEEQLLAQAGWPI
jgi:hypothetical protein